MVQLLIGTNNPSKLSNLRSYFDPDAVQCVSPADLGIAIEPIEDAQTAEGNALQKALAFHRATGMPVFTEDSGLVFLDLPRNHPDQPGVRVRRPKDHPPLTDDEEMLQYYLAVVHRHGGMLRAAWQDAWCLLADETHYALHADSDEALNRCAMTMVDYACPERHPGWPLDSLTLSSTTGKHWAALTLEEKAYVREHEFALMESDRRLFRSWLSESIEKLL